MKKIISLVLIGFILSGCSYFRLHKMDVEQGNIITPDKVNALQPGMTVAQVTDIMGNPLFVNLFAPDRMDYVYTYQPSHGDRVEKRVTCIFNNGKLKEVEALKS
jgi:outer membrane protein assembly factor BamE